MHLPLLLAAIAVGVAPQDTPTRVDVGTTVEGVIDADAPPVSAPGLEASGKGAGAVSSRFDFVADEAGAYTIDARSYLIDSYLIVRDDEGAVLAENDDWILHRHARVVLPEVDAGAVIVVDVCAVGPDRGAFELDVRRGAPPELSPAEVRALRLADLERRVEVVGEVLGPRSAQSAVAINDLGTLCYRQGDYARARENLELSLEITVEVHGDEHPSTVILMSNLAVLIHRLGDFDGARDLLERAVAIREERFGPDHPRTAKSLHDLAAVVSTQGQYEDARAMHEQVLAIRLEHLGEMHPDTARTLDGLGVVCRKLGDYEAAEAYYERALVIYEELAGPEHPATASCLHNLSALHDAQGRFDEARPRLERALAIREKTLGPDHPDTGSSLNSLAALLQIQGDLLGAEVLYERALAIAEAGLGPNHPMTGISLDNLALVRMAQGRSGEARPLLERSLVILEGTLGRDHPSACITRNNVAACLEEEGELDRARELLETTLAIQLDTIGPDHPDASMTHNLLASVQRAQGDAAAARENYVRALAIREATLGVDHKWTSIVATNIATLDFDVGRVEDAWAQLRRSYRDREAHVRRVLASLSEGERYAYLAHLSWQLELQLAVARSLGDPAIQTQAYEAVLGWKGSVGRLLTASRSRVRAEMGEEQRALLDELAACQAELSRLVVSSNATDPNEHGRRLDDLRTERGRLERALVGVEAAGTRRPSATHADLRAALGPNAALVDAFEYRLYVPGDGEEGHWDPSRFIVWITRADGEHPIVVDLGPSAAIEAAIRAFLEDLVARRGVDESDDSESNSAAALRAVLLDPITPHLEGVETVFVSPDGVLGTLPFETLLLEDGRRAIERYAFVYLQDVTTLLEDAPARKEAPSVLSVGGVDFRTRDEWEPVDAVAAVSPPSAEIRGGFADFWGRLPATEYESQVVVDLHEGAFEDAGTRLLLQARAPSEERLKHELQRFTVLHLATHGYFQPKGMPSMWESAKNATGEREVRMRAEARRLIGSQPGLLSGLVCAGANLSSDLGRDAAGDDGYLTAEEVGWLDLSGVDLVVLSACETGLGRPQSGEGLIGLRRAFRTAGARTVISSLWSVKDRSTAELVQAFYGNLWLRGMPRHAALRAAQISMLTRNRALEGEDRPSTWGAFVLSGEWR